MNLPKSNLPKKKPIKKNSLFDYLYQKDQKLYLILAQSSVLPIRLRKIFDAYKSDEKSIEIAKHFDFDAMRQIRRRNFTILSENAKLNGWEPVFTTLGDDDIPSHYTIYCADRADMEKYLDQNNVKHTAFWPQPPMIDDISKYPGAKYINTHVLSVQLDQRWNEEDMHQLPML